MSKQPQNTIAGCCEENDPCGLCDLTMADIAIDHLESNWDDPKALKKSIPELLEDDCAPYDKFLFWRLQKLEPYSSRMERLRTEINDRIFWGARHNNEKRA